MTPVVSVLLPFRDAAATIDAALETTLAERAVDLEIVCVDDGSTDGGAACVRAVAASDPRVVLVRTERVGIARALERARGLARGTYLARMDADDLSLPGRFPKQLALLASDERLAAVGCRVRAFPDVADGMRRYLDWQNAIVTPEEHAREMFVESPLCHPSVVLRREPLERVGGWRDAAWFEDYDLWLRLDAAGYRLAKVPEVLFAWRQGPERATRVDPRAALLRFFEAKANYLAPRLAREGKPVAIWGAGQTGKRLGRELARRGVTAEFFVDIDPRKVGRTAHGRPIVAPERLVPGSHRVVVAVGAPGARDTVRRRLERAGFSEGADFVCAA